MTTTNEQLNEQNVPCGFVAIIGLPNAGKSTLMNRYLDEKVSIVSPKPQTTRANVTCILSAPEHQVIFIDTPGILRPRYRMQEVMSSFIQNAIAEADLLLVMVDALKFRDDLHPRLVKLTDTIVSKKTVIALNKVDMIKPKTKLLSIIESITNRFPHAEVVPISALTGDGTDHLFKELIKLLPVGPKLYPDDIISTDPERFFVSEIIRESIFLSMKEEIPYASAVIIENFTEEPGLVSIHATILVEKNSQKPIIIGKHGATIKEIGTKARAGIEEFLGNKVFLDLHVKVRKDWRNRDVFLHEIGLKR